MQFDVESYADSMIGIHRQEYSSSGHAELVCTCPECGKPKLYINAESGQWICYRCAADQVRHKGGLVSLIALIEGVSFGRAKRQLREGMGRITPSIDRLWKRRAKRDSKPLDTESHTPHYPESFRPVWDPKTRNRLTIPYLKDRDIKWRTAAKFGLGLCTTGRFVNRVILPLYTRCRMVGYQGRKIGSGDPKYLTEQWDISFFGWNQPIDTAKPLVLVEGAFDVLKLHQYGVQSVAILGKSLSTAQRALLRRSEIRDVIFMLDGEAAREAAKCARSMLPVFNPLLALLPHGTDPADAPEPDVMGALRDARPVRFSDTIEVARVAID